MYEYGTVKPLQVIPRRGVGERGRIMEGMNQASVLYVYIHIYIYL
jgi:hypothetical protein